MDGDVEIGPVAWGDREWAREMLTAHWGSADKVSKSRAHDASRLPGLIAKRGDEPVGLLTYHLLKGQCEVVTLNALLPGHGIGTRLLDACVEKARHEDCTRMWLVVTNDDVLALRFYQRRGWDLVALHRDAVTSARKIWPHIPEHGTDGIPIRHEIELERPV
jgi:GNAT superfamily N-acetyltransferase